MNLLISLQAPPQDGGTFRLILLAALIGIVFLVNRYMKKNEVANSNIEKVENLNEQLLEIIAKYRNGFLIIILASVLQLINTYSYLSFLNSRLSGFKFEDMSGNYFDEIKTSTTTFEVFTIVSIILYLLGFLKLWSASKIKK